MKHEGICIGHLGDGGCGYRGGKSGDNCPNCGGMLLSQKSIDYADEAAKQWDLSVKSGTSRTPTTSSSASVTDAPDVF